MRRLVLLGSGLLAAVLVLAVCVMLLRSGERNMVRKSAEPLQAYAVAEAPPPPGIAAAQPPVAEPIKVMVPQIAYSYTLGYRLPAGAIAGAQQAHVALCDRLGPARCQVLSMQRKSGEDGRIEASLKLRVASGLVQGFTAELSRLVSASGGLAVDTSVTADDVSRDLVDTEARLRQREILVTRLTDMLRNRQGRVSELVEAERSIAQAQEELDQARGWLGELRGRVAFSEVSVDYAPVAPAAPSPRGFAAQLGDSVLQSVALVGGALRGLLTLLIFALPWLLLGAALILPGRALLGWWRRAGLAPVKEDA